MANRTFCHPTSGTGKSANAACRLVRSAAAAVNATLKDRWLLCAGRRALLTAGRDWRSGGAPPGAARRLLPDEPCARASM
jgi:hypothetical protein